eukprot:453878-Pyramimonas_sp.AAC.1
MGERRSYQGRRSGAGRGGGGAILDEQLLLPQETTLSNAVLHCAYIISPVFVVTWNRCSRLIV